MCLGIPGKIVEMPADHADLARVDVSGVRRAIDVGLLEGEELRPGDWILIHAGFALSKIDKDEARAAMEFLEGIGQAYDELAALKESSLDASGRGEA
ncbi:HypC/HybG/HupF family hydrogenase formation chaperone [Streptosporangium algeriense]|uniref:HypC/HybG/HupF family hydrogenase formation chaperone n=1 Tax=Streptosporangium algeriense TaxID=1682748 RepID=A0ABW3DZ31_9ACTN